MSERQHKRRRADVRDLADFLDAVRLSMPRGWVQAWASLDARTRRAMFLETVGFMLEGEPERLRLTLHEARKRGYVSSKVETREAVAEAVAV